MSTPAAVSACATDQAKPDDVLATVRRYLEDASLRASLPPAKR